MPTNLPQPIHVERRSEQRQPSQPYFSVCLSVKDLDMAYQFRLRDLSAKGLCILVRHDSDLLNHLQVGDILDVKYYLSDKPGQYENKQTRIRHITRNDTGPFQGHCLVGLSIQ